MILYFINSKEERKRLKYIRKVIYSLNLNCKAIRINAIDGKSLIQEDILKSFDLNKYNKKNLWAITQEEIACCLSHRKCYQSLIASDEEYALVFEDDIIINNNFKEYLQFIDENLKSNVPRIILLSGWYWYSSKKIIDSKHYLCKIFDGRLAHAYFINKIAAKLILEKKPYYVADNWNEIKNIGIELYGFKPHFIDQNYTNDFNSTIQKGYPGVYNFGLTKWVKLKLRGVKRRMYKISGKYERYVI